MAERQLTDLVQLLVGIVNIVQAVHKPGIAIGIGILQRHGGLTLQGNDEVLRVQHVQYGEDAVAVHLGHIAGSLVEGLAQPIDFRTDIGIGQFLIAAQLGSMIAADALQIERGLVLVEGIRGQIQHTIVGRLVLQDMVNGCRLGHGFLANALRYEHRVVQVTLVDLPHVNQTQHRQQSYRPRGTQLLIPI